MHSSSESTAPTTATPCWATAHLYQTNINACCTTDNAISCGWWNRVHPLPLCFYFLFLAFRLHAIFAAFRLHAILLHQFLWSTTRILLRVHGLLQCCVRCRIRRRAGAAIGLLSHLTSAPPRSLPLIPVHYSPPSTSTATAQSGSGATPDARADRRLQHQYVGC